MSDDLTRRRKVQEGSELEPLHPIVTVKTYQVVYPSDGSPSLPQGIYEVSALEWLVPSVGKHIDGQPSYTRGIATFVVMSGPQAGSKRRIAGIYIVKTP